MGQGRQALFPIILPKLPSSDQRQAVESEQAAGQQEQAWKPVLPGRLAGKEGTQNLDLLPGRRHQWSAALAPRSCGGENQVETYFKRERVELIFGEGLTKKRTEDVADARQSPWGNGKSFLKELLGLLLVSGYFTCDV